MIDWNLQSRSHQCQACEKSFVDKQPYHTVLSDEKIGYQRLDVCDPCWTAQYSQGAADRKGFVSHWHGVYIAPPAHAPDAIKQETAESLLRKLVERNEPRHLAARYILAVMLERKRILKVKSQIRSEGRRVFVYEHAGNADVFTIADPDLQLDQLEEVQREVGHLLEQGLDQPTAEAAPVVAETAAATPSESSAEVTPANN